MRTASKPEARRQLTADQGQCCIHRAPEPSMYTSEPLPGIQSPFYVGDKYIADAETVRRARLAAAELRRG